MTGARGGQHADVCYVFEDNGFNTSPTDTTFKTFGGNATPDTFEGSHNAVRVFNADRKAAEIIEQTFDGSWSVTTEGFTEPPWWLAALYGQPTSTNVAGNLYEHSYDIDNGNDPVSLRLYMPTDGFASYKYIGGAVIASVSVDQSSDGSPEISISGAYAQEPQTASSLSPTVPDFAETSFSNRDAEAKIAGTTIGKAQNTTVNIEANTELIGEIGSENAVDFIPKAWEPDVTFDKILSTTQSVDPLSKFTTGAQASVELIYDNGETGDSQYVVDLNAEGALPSDWSESGRNDSEANLVEELQNMAEDLSVTVTEDIASPPGA